MSPTFYQHLRRTRRNAPVIEQHAFIDPFVVTSHCLNVEIVCCALWRLRESRSWADQIIILKPFYVVDGFWTGSHLNRKQRVNEKTAILKDNLANSMAKDQRREQFPERDITVLPTTCKLMSLPTFTCNMTFSPSLTSMFSRGVTMVGLAPLLCLDGSFVTGEPGVAPSALSVTSTDSENWETIKGSQSWYFESFWPHKFT